jgi:hypothetical protein
MNKNRIALLSIALGFWLIALPLTLGYRCPLIEGSDLVSGLLLIAFSLLCLSSKRAWPGWVIGLVGVWLQIAPLLFWAPLALMYINDTVIGALAIVFSFQLAKTDSDTRGSSCPKGWSYNPSGWEHRIPTVALAMLCWFFSRYMACFQLGYIDHIWDPFFPNGTLQVITSNISKSFPVSDAGLGAICYTLEFLLGWQGSSRRWYRMPWLVFVFAFLVIPVGIVSITLIILQPVVVGAWCSWCLATAAAMLLMILLTAGELVAVLQLLKETRQKGGSLSQVFWKGVGSPLPKVAPAAPRKALKFSIGATLPWNLALSIFLGIWLMASPAVLQLNKNLAVGNFILGPMIVAFSVIACAEAFRSIRYLNVLFGLALILLPWIVTGSRLGGVLNDVSMGILIVALAFRRGPVWERYGAWERLIK